MKKTIVGLMALAMVFSLPVSNNQTTKAGESYVYQYVNPGVKRIKVRFDKSKKVSYVKVYKATVTRKYLKKHYMIPKKKYKYFKKTSKKILIDRKVKKNKLYLYYTKAYNKKGKLVAKDINTNCSYAYSIGKPKTPTFDMAYEHEEPCNANDIRLQVKNNPESVYPSSFIIYRKKVGAKKFKKLKTVKVKKKGIDYEQNLADLIVHDKKVKAGTKYCYKAKICVKEGKKKYYSKFSKTAKIWAVDFHGSFDVTSLTDEFTMDARDGKTPEKTDFELKITYNNKKKTNGLIKMHGGSDMQSMYNCKMTKEGGYESCYYSFNEYSYDRKKWHAFGSGVILEEHKPIFVRGDLFCEPGMLMHFGGNRAIDSNFEVYDMFSYYGPSLAWERAEGRAVLTKGKHSFIHPIGPD